MRPRQTTTTDTGKTALPNLIRRLAELAPLAVAALLFSRHLFADPYGDEWGHTRPLVTGDTFWTDLFTPGVCHPPLFFVLARLAWAATHADWAMRLPSLIAALATVWLAGPLAQKVGGRTLVLPARWLAALSPFVMDFATEARAYSLLLLFATGSVWAFLRMMDSENRRNAAVLAAMLTAGMLTHYFFGFLLAFLAVWYTCRRSRITRPALIGFAPPLLAAALLAVLVFVVQRGAASENLQVEWMREHLSVPNFLARLAAAMNYGYCTFWLPPLDPARNIPLTSVICRNIPQFILLAVAACGFAAAFWRMCRNRTPHLLFLSSGIAAPTLLAVTAGAMGTYLVREKHLAVIWPFVLLLAALAVRELLAARLGRLPVAAHLALTILSATHFLVYPNVYSRRMDWRGLREALDSARKPDVVMTYRLDARAFPAAPVLTDPSVPDRLVAGSALRRGESFADLAQRIHLANPGRVLLVNHETDRHLEDPKGMLPNALSTLRSCTVMPFGRNLQLYVFAPPEGRQ